MYWILANELEDEDKDAFLRGETDFELGGGVSFEEGVSHSRSKIPDITLTLSSKSRSGNMTDRLLITAAYGLVFSSRLRELLDGMGVDNIEYYDFEIVNPRNGKKYSDYKIANVVGLVDCVDRGKSDLKYFDDGEIKRINKLVIDESRIPSGMRIFRLANRPILTFVHQSVKEAMESAGITGCVFCSPGEYH